MFEIAISVAAFTGLIVGLVFILNIASNFLVDSGPVTLDINGGKKVAEISAGDTLLGALIGQGIFLPSACGGGGSCAQCKCKIVSGGGEVLPTEEGHLSRKEQKEGVRLACQVKVKEDMHIEVEEEIFGIQKFKTKVRSNHNVATFIKELVLEFENGQTIDFKNGGYIQIEVPVYECSYKEFDIEKEYHPDWDKFDIWKYHSKVDEPLIRAYSMANHPAENDIVMLNVRIASPPPGRDDLPPGQCSSWIFNLKPGDEVTISGPYGEFFIQETEREMCFIGGGAGMAPMRSHIFHLFNTVKTSRKGTFWYGARSRREMFYHEQFLDIEKRMDNFKYTVALSDAMPEDKWEGSKGFIHNVLLEEYLNNHEDPTEIEYYLCGPPIMNKCVIEMLDSLGVEPDMIRLDDFGG
ncbi:MAG: NADH:ubiquinone reductase (Na(+)-transporting) subunit F [Candidatus Cloacimonadota bacterium]|nr:MAG: NADH:ubiquinone reductase (Na(+)-transporting) subunit F [Candidatus Cloacimonadota bacterium]